MQKSLRERLRVDSQLISTSATVVGFIDFISSPLLLEIHGGLSPPTVKDGTLRVP